MNVREKIKTRLDILEADLKAGRHLGDEQNRDDMNELISSVGKFSSVLSSSDRDFINAAKHAVADSLPWT